MADLGHNSAGNKASSKGHVDAVTGFEVRSEVAAGDFFCRHSCSYWF